MTLNALTFTCVFKETVLILASLTILVGKMLNVNQTHIELSADVYQIIKAIHMSNATLLNA